jgi:hypothetical protein
MSGSSVSSPDKLLDRSGKIKKGLSILRKTFPYWKGEK